MTSAPAPATRPAPRRDALIDLGLWLMVIGLLLAAAYGLQKIAAPLWVRILLGEPVQMIALLAASTAILRRRGESWRDLGLMRPASWRRTAGLVLFGLVAAYGLNALLVFLVYRPLGIAPPNVSALAPLIGSPATYAMMLGLTWTTVAFGEELQFRGFLFSRLARLFGPSRAGLLAAWLAQGAVFGAGHGYQGLGGLLTTSVIGLVMGGVYLLGRRSLAACIVLHGLIDTIGLTTVFYMAQHGIKLPG